MLHLCPNPCIILGLAASRAGLTNVGLSNVSRQRLTPTADASSRSSQATVELNLRKHTRNEESQLRHDAGVSPALNQKKCFTEDMCSAVPHHLLSLARSLAHYRSLPLTYPFIRHRLHVLAVGNQDALHRHCGIQHPKP
jgi:hypothetical protein